MSNTIDFIKKSVEGYVIRNFYKECFSIGNFSIPKRLITNRNNKISLEKNRKHLLRNESPYSLNMTKYLNNNKIDYLKEFIVIIQDKVLWRDIISTFNVSNKEKKNYEECNYFSLDFFLPNNLTCIEVDSNYHFNRTSLDEARDIYLDVKFSIRTIRFYHFGENNIVDFPKLVDLKNRINQINIDSSNLFSYFDVMINNFLYENEFIVTMIERFIDYIGLEKFFKNKEFKITEKEYNYLATGINFGNNVRPILVSLEFINLIKELFNRTVIIYRNIINYKFSDITYILNSNKDIFREIISAFNSIPYWVSVVKCVPEEFKSFIKESTGEDLIILKYLRNGKITSEKPSNS